LVKGLQVDHAVITAPGKLGKNDLYVALTKACLQTGFPSR
jgi:hypothetical protein